MDVTIDFDATMSTTTIVVELQDDGSFRIRCSRAVDIETLLALDRGIAHQIADAARS